MDKIGVLLSSAFTNGSLEVEFGKVPSSFIPFKNQRLYVQQVNFLKGQNCAKVHLYLPVGFHLPFYDEEVLSGLGVEVFYSSPYYSAFQAYQNVLLDFYNRNGSFEVLFLFGDTHIEIGHLINSDTLLVNTASYNYKWSMVDDTDFVNVGCFLITIDQVVIEKLFKSGMQSYDQYFSHLIKDSINLERDFIWYDFGHLFTYYESLTNDFILREFNEIKYLDGIIYKSSTDTKKLDHEINWYKDLPKSLKIYSPRIIEYSTGEKAFYAMEYIRAPTLSTLAVFGNLQFDQWDTIFKSVFRFIRESRIGKQDKSKNLLEIVGNKTIDRIASYPDVYSLISQVSHDNLMNMIAIVNCELDGCFTAMPAYSHGDLCFTNIMFDSKSAAIKCIDPRGRSRNKAGQTISEFDDSHYDLAKLMHSVFGGYDLIINNRYYLDRLYSGSLELPDLETKPWASLRVLFRDSFINEFGLDAFKSSYLLSIHLFISMVPLHYDCHKRQKAFLQNACRLFDERNLWF